MSVQLVDCFVEFHAVISHEDEGAKPDEALDDILQALILLGQLISFDGALRKTDPESDLGDVKHEKLVGKSRNKERVGREGREK